MCDTLPAATTYPIATVLSEIDRRCPHDHQDDAGHDLSMLLHEDFKGGNAQTHILALRDESISQRFMGIVVLSRSDGFTGTSP